MKLYALHDKKAQALSSFHVERSDVVASRGFVEATLGKDSQFAKYPEDFELVSLCDVSQEYEGLPDSMIANVEFRVVITAAQVLAAQPAKSEQLQLLKEA
jgi:hypothetical protein